MSKAPVSADASRSVPRVPILLISTSLDEDSLNRLRDYLRTLPTVEFLGDLGEKADLLLFDRQKHRLPDACIVDLDRDREKALRMVSRAHEVMPTTAIFALSSKSDPDLIINAMRDGCTEYLLKPLNRGQLADSLARLEDKKREQRKPQGNGKIITLQGVKGGTGATVLASHLAVFLAKAEGRKTLLIDQHPDLGDVSLYLGMGKHQYHFFELVNNIHRLDAALLQGFLRRHPSGLDVLASPDAFDAAGHVAPEAVEETLEFLKGVYEFVVADCPPGLSRPVISTIEKSERVYLVATPELPAIRGIARYLSHLMQFNLPPGRVHILINRYSKWGAIDQQQIERVIRTRVSLTIPNSYAEVIEAINTGNPASSDGKTGFITAMRQWAATLAGGSRAAAVTKQDSKNFLGILRL